ncbi:MAG: hypothetical protein ACE5GV_02845 [Candidatus Scalindua sp.]
MVSIHKTYKEKILEEIDEFPGDKMSKLYRIIHLLVTELRSETKKQEIVAH